MEVIREHRAFAPVSGLAGPAPAEPYPESGRAAGGLEDVLRQILDGARDLAGADLGNVQLVDPVSGGLWIAAQDGFGPEFLEHFGLVVDDDSACGRAARVCAQTVIADVELDADFAPHRAIAAASGFRAVVSTPLTARSGTLVGMVSTHLRRPGRVEEHALRPLRVYGRLAGELVARTWDPGVARSDEAIARAAQDAVNRIFAASLLLTSAAASDTVWRERLEEAAAELDLAVRGIQTTALAAARG
jgi:GAF domain-containing protein